MGEALSFDSKSSFQDFYEKRCEKTRRWIVRLVYLFLWLFFLEGVLRKWVFPDAHQMLFFVRDPVTLAIYFLAFNSPFWPKDSRLWTGCKILFFLALPTVFLPRDYAIGNIIFLYGLRNFFFFVPLFYIVRAVLNLEDLRGLLRHYLVFAVPITLLVTQQFGAGMADPVNVGYGVGYFRSMEVSGKFVRPSGPFGSVQVQNVFVAGLWAILLGAWFLHGKNRLIRPVYLALASGCGIVCLAVGGSRGAFVHTIVVSICLFAILFLSGRAKKEISFGSILLFFSVLALGSYFAFAFFYEPLVAIFERATTLAQLDADVGDTYSLGILNRVLFSFISFLERIEDCPLFGYGIGTSSNAASSLGVSAVGAEDDWGRQIVELGPILGIAYILLRIGFSYVVFRETLTASRTSGVSLPFLLGGFVTVILINGQITGNGSITGFIWFFAGLTLNAARHYGKLPEESLPQGAT